MNENRNSNEQMTEILNGLTDEQKEKAKDCKDVNEFISALGEMGVTLPDELLDAVAGGIIDFTMVPFYCKNCNGTSYWPAYIVDSRTEGMQCKFCKGHQTYKVEN